MQIEDWEKELKKQIMDEPQTVTPKVNDNPVKNEQPDLSQQPKVNEDPKSLPPPVQLVVNNQQQDGSGTWMFVLMLIALAAATLYVYDDKTGGKLKSSITSSFHSKTESKTIIEKSDAEVAKLKAELDKFRSDNKAAIDSIQAKLNTNSTKIGLMGMLLNENFTMIMRGEGSSDFIFFNRDWTLDRMPKHIELTEDDREYLKKMVRSGQ